MLACGPLELEEQRISGLSGWKNGNRYTTGNKPGSFKAVIPIP